MSKETLFGGRLPTLTGHRVTLRWMEERDVAGLLAIFGDPDAMRYWSTPPLKDLAAAAEYRRDIEASFCARTLFQWGLARRTDDQLIGTCTLCRLEQQHRRAELGFALRRDHWGKGWMSEAIAMLIEYAFGAIDLYRLEADVDPRNDRSIRLLERAGFRREGHLRARYHVNGEIQDSLLLGLLKPAWTLRARE